MTRHGLSLRLCLRGFVWCVHQDELVALLTYHVLGQNVSTAAMTNAEIFTSLVRGGLPLQGLLARAFAVGIFWTFGAEPESLLGCPVGSLVVPFVFRRVATSQ